MAVDQSKVLSLVETIKQTALQDQGACRSAQSHFQLLGLIDELRLAVETPTETVLRLIYQVSCFFPFRSGDYRLTCMQPPQNAALRTVMDLGIFPLLVEQSKCGMSATELAAQTGAERGLIGKMIAKVFTVSAHTYSPSDASHDRTGLVRKPRIRSIHCDRQDRRTHSADRKRWHSLHVSRYIDYLHYCMQY